MGRAPCPHCRVSVKPLGDFMLNTSARDVYTCPSCGTYLQVRARADLWLWIALAVLVSAVPWSWSWMLAVLLFGALVLEPALWLVLWAVGPWQVVRFVNGKGPTDQQSATKT